MFTSCQCAVSVNGLPTTGDDVLEEIVEVIVGPGGRGPAGPVRVGSETVS
jgi:hypothetical protein